MWGTIPLSAYAVSAYHISIRMNTIESLCTVDADRFSDRSQFDVGCEWVCVCLCRPQRETIEHSSKSDRIFVCAYRSSSIFMFIIVRSIISIARSLVFCCLLPRRSFFLSLILYSFLHRRQRRQRRRRRRRSRYSMARMEFPMPLLLPLFFRYIVY